MLLFKELGYRTQSTRGKITATMAPSRRRERDDDHPSSPRSVSLFAVFLLGFPSFCAARDTSTISAGFEHTCIISSQSTVKCFGSNTYGQLGIGDTTSHGNSADEANGMGDLLPAVDIGTNASAVAVSAGWTHTCAILDTGGVKCWGRNDWGQLGQGDYIDRGDDPLLMGDSLAEIDLGLSPSGNSTAFAIGVTTGKQFTCVLVEGGGVKCFGRNDEGQCGRGNLDDAVGSDEEDMGDSLPYVYLGTGVEAVSVSSGTATTCVALLDGGIKCWGGNSYGGVGVGDSYNRGDEASDMGDNLAEVDLGTDEVGYSVYSGLRHHCAILLGGNIKCWGDNRSGQLGLGHVDTIGDDDDEIGDALPHVDLATSGEVSSLSLGESHTCALFSGDGSVRCWGKGYAGQLGDEQYRARGKNSGEMGSELSTVNLGTNVTAATISAGHDHTCAALGDGSLKCWGLNTDGALGLGDTEARGDEEGEMGDDLPAVSLGTGITVKAEGVVTLSPTQAPTLAPVPATPRPTQEPSNSPSIQPSTKPTAEPTARPTTPAPTKLTPTPIYPTVTPEYPTPSTPSPVSADDRVVNSPVPTPAASTSEPLNSSQTDAMSADEEGVLSGDNIRVAAYIGAPIFLAFLVLACLCGRRYRNHRDDSDDALAAAAPDSSKRMSKGRNGHSGGSNGGMQGNGRDPQAGGLHIDARSRGWTNSGGSSNGSARVMPASRCPESSPVHEGEFGNGFGTDMGVEYMGGTRVDGCDWAAVSGTRNSNTSKPEPPPIEKQEMGRGDDIDEVFAWTSRSSSRNGDA